MKDGENVVAYLLYVDEIVSIIIGLVENIKELMISK